MRKIRGNIKAMIMAVLAIGMLCIPGIGTQKVQAATLIWPVPGHTGLSQGYHDSKAIDICDSGIAGADVVASMSGNVAAIWLCGSQHFGSMHDCQGFGTGLVIKGTDGRFYQYAHMRANSIPSNVYYGGWVSAGQKIGQVGTTGNSSGNHLHFGITTGTWYNNSGINPLKETYSYGTTAVNITYSDMSASSVTANGADLHAIIHNPARATVSQVGTYVWDSAGKLVVNRADNCGLNLTKMDQWLYGTSAGLTPGKTYTWQMWAKVGDKMFYSAKSSFTTLDNVKPYIGNVWITDSTTEGYTLNCTATDNVGVSCVIYGTWTSKAVNGNAKDDYEEAYAQRNGSTFSFRVNRSRHNGEYGPYETRIWAYDAAGNCYGVMLNEGLYVKKPAVVSTPAVPKKPAQTIKAANKTLVAGKKASLGAKRTKGNGKLTYSSSNSRVVSVSSSGKLTAKSAGTATITIKAAATSKYSQTVKKITVTVKPAAPKIKKISNTGKGTATVSWKKASNVTGYQIQYATNKSFKNAKYGELASNKYTKARLTKLSRKKTYYMRMRSYRIVSGKIYYSSWSAKKSVKIKK